jgi:hypothetical protein
MMLSFRPTTVTLDEETRRLLNAIGVQMAAEANYTHQVSMSEVIRTLTKEAAEARKIKLSKA